MSSTYIETQLVTIGVFILIGWAHYLPMRAGQIYNGPIFCMAIGGYFAAKTSTHLGWPLPAAFLGGVIASALVGFVLSFVLRRLTGMAMAIATIALIFIVQTTFRNLDFFGALTGIIGIPELPGILLMTYGLLGVIALLLYRFTNSRWGRAAEAVDVDPKTAAAMGVDLKKMSTVLQTLSATMGGLAGVIYAFNLSVVHPSVFGFNLLLYAFMIVWAGGRTTPWGVPILAPILWLLPELAPPVVGVWRNVMFAVVVIGFLLFRPHGVITKDTVSALEGALGSKVPDRTPS